ncbi:MAG: esterase family protein [Victivallaceae bacterium]|nr:esterase family protein [Victivallaceae bacterium]
MALVNCDFFSETLGMSSSMTVILPQQTQGQIGLDGVAGDCRPPVLYLLHGFSDDHTTWLRRTSIERYVAELGLAVVMPNVHRSFYTNMVYGGRYWDFVSDELPQLVKTFFNLSERREDTFVAGLSMGGYGALKLALNCPERFAAAASLSGVTDIFNWAETTEREDFKFIFGENSKIPNSDSDLFYLAQQLVNNATPLPALYQCCGTEDFLYEDNQRFKAHLESLKVNFTYSEAPGNHNWAFWDEHIQNVLKWLPLGK